MGYYARYSLSILNEVEIKNEIHGFDSDGNPATIYQYETITVEKLEDKFLKIMGSFPFGDDEIKWSSYDDDMRSFSKIYPDVVFVLDVKGEDSDIWRMYYKNGKAQWAEPVITFDEFNESELK